MNKLLSVNCILIKLLKKKKKTTTVRYVTAYIESKESGREGKETTSDPSAAHPHPKHQKERFSHCLGFQAEGFLKVGKIKKRKTQSPGLLEVQLSQRPKEVEGQAWLGGSR